MATSTVHTLVGGESRPTTSRATGSRQSAPGDEGDANPRPVDPPALAQQPVHHPGHRSRGDVDPVLAADDEAHQAARKRSRRDALERAERQDEVAGQRRLGRDQSQSHGPAGADLSHPEGKRQNEPRSRHLADGRGPRAVQDEQANAPQILVDTTECEAGDHRQQVRRGSRVPGGAWCHASLDAHPGRMFAPTPIGDSPRLVGVCLSYTFSDTPGRPPAHQSRASGQAPVGTTASGGYGVGRGARRGTGCTGSR